MAAKFEAILFTKSRVPLTRVLGVIRRSLALDATEIETHDDWDYTSVQKWGSVMTFQIASKELQRYVFW